LLELTVNCIFTMKVFVCLLCQRYVCIPTPRDVVLYKYFPVVDKNRLVFQQVAPGFHKINSAEIMTELILMGL
jgi:hypothetical protein